MTSTQVCSDAAVVYLVINTIMNLRTQSTSRRFANATAHPGPGGRFVIETMVPELRRLARVKRSEPSISQRTISVSMNTSTSSDRSRSHTITSSIMARTALGDG